jgi:hypothetical protein
VIQDIEGIGTAVDVAIMATPYVTSGAGAGRPIQFFERSIHIFENLWLAKFSTDIAHAVMTACEAPGENVPTFRQFGGPFGILRVAAAGEDPVQFDPDGRLAACIALSRLAHPTSLDHQYAARVVRPANGTRSSIPGQPSGQLMFLSRRAFVSEDTSNWLIPDDIPLIGKLAASYFTSPPSKRVNSALWYLESAFRSYFVEHRWPFLVAGLESLVHIRDEKSPPNSRRWATSTEVFVKRLGKVGKRLQESAFDDEKLRKMYDRRSGLVHGQGLGQMEEETRGLYPATESLLRTGLRRALLDTVFAAIFRSDYAVSQELPIV